jgi:predicted transcriptional regulator of viral defense system
MNDLALARKLERGRLAVFTTQQMAVTLGLGPASARVRLNRLVERGVLARPIRGRYCLPSADHLAVASGIYQPSYASLMAAFEHHGTTTQSARIIDIVNPTHSGRMALHLESGDFKVRFVKVAGRLVFGYLRVLRQGAAANVADKEKAVIDTLLLPGYAPLDEAVACIRSGIDPQKAMEYARRTGRQAVVKRLGFLLSMAGLGPDASTTGRLSKTYVPLDPSGPRRGVFDREWRVIVNRVIE